MNTQNNNLSVFENEAVIHLKEIYRAARRMARNEEDAEELVQETFMQAWKSIDKYEAGTNCRAGLHQILFHKHSHQIRRHAIQRKYFQGADEIWFANAEKPKDVPGHLTDKVVIGSLNQLPNHYRSVVLLVDVYEFGYKEAAAILSLPIGTVMSRLHRARNMLKISLGGLANECGIGNLQEA